MPHAHPLFEITADWRLAFWLSYGAWFLVEMAIFSRDRRKVSGERRDRGSLFVIVGLMVVGIYAAFAFVYWSGAPAIGLPANLTLGAGIVLIWAGIAFRLWAVVTLGRFFRFTVVVQDDHRLITSGPYRLLRNPSYTGGLITVIGVGLMLGNWASLACIAGGLLIGYAVRIRVEEQALAAHFGQAFADYRQRSWALIPFVW